MCKEKEIRKRLTADRHNTRILNWSSTEIKSTITILLISIIYTLIYLPCGISWTIFAIYAAIELKTPEQLEIYFHSTKLSHTFLLLTGSVRIFHFLILCTIPTFRMALLNVFSKRKGNLPQINQEQAEMPGQLKNE